MADGVLGLGSGQAASLNNELIEKLKTAERASTVEPIEDDISSITNEESGETVTLANITSKANELLDAINPFYQYNSDGVTVFDLKTANTTGSSVVFDATNEKSLNTGTTTVHVEQLAKRDVFQSGEITAADISSDIGAGVLSIAIAGSDGSYSETFDFDTSALTYEELVTQINYNSNFTASLEQVGDEKYRLVIKSQDSGEANALQIRQDSSQSLGFGIQSTATNSIANTSASVSGDLTLDGVTFSLDGSTVGSTSYDDLVTQINDYEDIDGNNVFSASFDGEGILSVKRLDGVEISPIIETDFNFGFESTKNGQTVTAQNLIADVNGVDYNLSSNVITVDGGLKITAVEENDAGEFSTISIEKDTAYIATYLQNFVDKYNELIELVDEELYNTESSIEDKSSLRSMMEGIKSKLFGSYGEDQNLNVFNFGLEINEYGVLDIDTDALNEIISNDLDSLKDLFFDAYYKDDNDESQTIKGLGSDLKEYIDALDGFDGLLYSYEQNILSRQETLEEEKEKAIETLDNKYDSMAAQFAAYNTIINLFEAQFSGLSLMIEQSVSTS